jgi:Fe-S cluster biogenesis protein NfuA
MNKINPELKIKELLDDLRPFLNGDGGDIEFIKYEEKYVYIKLTGACANCGFQDETISFGIEAYLKDQVPEIEGVINVDV